MEKSLGQRAADWVTEFSGSWGFILSMTASLMVWVLLNITKLAFDPYPFLFLNWVLTTVSTIQTPLIMLSQNRQNEMDRERVQEIYRKMDEILALLKI